MNPINNKVAGLFFSSCCSRLQSNIRCKLWVVVSSTSRWVQRWRLLCLPRKKASLWCRAKLVESFGRGENVANLPSLEIWRNCRNQEFICYSIQDWIKLQDVCHFLMYIFWASGNTTACFPAMSCSSSSQVVLASRPAYLYPSWSSLELMKNNCEVRGVELKSPWPYEMHAMQTW